jgi:hypothetical protein
VFRASAGSGFRAPGLDDLYAPQGLTNTGGNWDDPLYTAANGNCTSIAFCNTQLTARQGGNAELEPEKAKQFSIGLLFEPTANVSIGVDYFDIRMKNAISFVSGDDILADWYANQTGPGTSTSRFADRLVADAQTGYLSYVQAGYENVGELRIAGVDVSVKGRFATPLGTLRPGYEATYLTRDKSRFFDTEFSSNLGQYASSGPSIRLKQSISLGLDRGPWAVNGNYYWQSGYVDYSGARKVGAYETMDLQAQYTGIKNLSLTLSLRRQPDRAVEPDHLAVEHVVGDDLVHQLGVVLGRAQAAGEGHAGGQRVLHLLRHRNSIGVPKMPGAMVMLRMPLRARSRAMGSVMPTTPPLLAAVGGLADLAVVGGHAGGADQHAALAGGSGSFLHIASAARRIMLKLPTRLTMMVLVNRQRVRAVLAHGLDGRRDAGAVDQAHQLAQRRGRGHHGLAVGFLADVALDEDAADLLGHGLAALDLQVGDDDLAAVGGQHARRAFAQARRAAGDDEDLACDVHGMLLSDCVDVNVNCARTKRPPAVAARRRWCRSAQRGHARAVISSTLPVPLMRAYAAPVRRRWRPRPSSSRPAAASGSGRRQPLAHGLFLVVVALDQRLAGHVVLAGHLGRVELDVVGAARGRCDAAAAHALDDGASGTSISSTTSSLTPAAFIASACGMVRGKPSNRKPLAQSGCAMRSLTRPMMMSSLTRPPLSITFLAARPSGVPALTAARSMSPVEICGMPYFWQMKPACVPLPAPGAPNRISLIGPRRVDVVSAARAGTGLARGPACLSNRE